MISQSIRTTLNAEVFLTMFATHAIACGAPPALQGQLTAAQPYLRLMSTATASSKFSKPADNTPSIVGMWNVQYLAQGNSTRNPPIPDGALVDFGYSQWHSDGTEILNSGGHSPATYELNHFALTYDLTSQNLAAHINIREQVTLSPSGDMFSGTFTTDVYDPKGNHVDHIAGNIAGQRITVDTKPI